MTQNGRRGLDRARTMPGGDEHAQRFPSPGVPSRRTGPRDRDVFAQAVVAALPEIAQGIDDRAAGARRHRREGPDRLGANDRHGVETSGLREGAQVGRVRGVSSGARSLPSDERALVEKRVTARVRVGRSHERARANRTPARIHVLGEDARVGEAQTAAGDSSEGGVGPRRVVDAHSIGERAVEFVRAREGVAHAVGRIGGRRGEQLATGNLSGDRHGLAVAQRAGALPCGEDFVQGALVASFGRAHRGRPGARGEQDRRRGEPDERRSEQRRRGRARGKPPRKSVRHERDGVARFYPAC